MLIPIEKNNPTNSTPWVVISLIVINIILFLVARYNFELIEILTTFGFVSLTPNMSTAFTSLFLHAGLAHLVGNMFFLWMYGDNVEDVLGSALFALIYIVLGLMAVGVYYLSNSSAEVPLVGASGAISGILGLYIIFFPHAHVDLYLEGRNSSYLLAHLSARSSVLLWLGSQLLLGVLFMDHVGGVAFSAHIGGLICGVTVGYLLTTYWGYVAEAPKEVLSFKREKDAPVWCPYCGYQEPESEFRLYECPECSTQYEIVKADDYIEPAKPYKDQSKIDISALDDIPEANLPRDARRATVISEQDGSAIFYDGYIQSEQGKHKVLITLRADGRLKRYVEAELETSKDVDEFLRINTKFVLSDFVQEKA